MSARVTFEETDLICTGNVNESGHWATLKVLVDGRWYGDATCEKHRAEAVRYALEEAPWAP